MIVPKHGLLAGAQLKRAVPQITRVIIARTDGIALYDDVSLAARDGGAALTAALVGLAATVTRGFGMGAAESATVRGEHGLLVVAPVDAAHLLAAVVDPGPDGVDEAAVAAAVRVQAERLRVLSGTTRVAV
ncbi:roadblock/LC7 domain-containing protein [Demequina sp. NBRC 110056]|uniref:roadblock/LC7 domain-containing protein n=1 Tax=Demequina sp. NBRC 110056 TaxID=1570345 RepID=UPI0009FCECC8|nr:roadblock/LC7 domain-containing protein [Demequina sp. NBRC 110056]